MQKAIIYTQNRVIRRITTDQNPSIATGESVVDLPQDIDLVGGFWKLDAQNNKIAATSQEIDDADVDESRTIAKRLAKTQAVRSAVADIADNGATLSKIRTYFQALKQIQ